MLFTFSPNPGTHPLLPIENRRRPPSPYRTYHRIRLRLQPTIRTIISLIRARQIRIQHHSSALGRCLPRVPRTTRINTLLQRIRAYACDVAAGDLAVLGAGERLAVEGFERGWTRDVDEGDGGCGDGSVFG